MMDDKLPELPSGWVWTRLGEIAQVIRGASPRPKGNPKYFGGDIPWIMISDISKEKGKYISRTKDTVTNEGAKKSRYLRAGTLILSNSGTVCVPKILAVDGCIHDGFVAFPDLTENIDILYLYYFFDYIRPKIIQENRQGVTQINLNTNIVKEILILLPPLSEQQRIVTKIEELFTELDAGVEALKKVKTQLKCYRQAVLKYAFEGKLTEEWREMHSEELEPASVLLKRIKEERKKSTKRGYKELPPVDVSDLSELPEEWVWTRLGELVEPSDEKVDPLQIQKTPYIGLGHIEKDTGRLLCHGDSSEVRSTKSRFYAGDLLYGKLRPYLNKVYVADFDGICSTDILVFSKTPYVSNEYLLFRFLCGDFVRYANLNVSGVQHPRVSLRALSEFPLPLPPLPEQLKIVEEIEQKLSVADKIEKTVEQTLKQADRLRQSILKRAFEGKLVPQNPDDEPAYLLLERIKAEKAKKESKKIQRSRKKSEKYEQKRLINYDN